MSRTISTAPHSLRQLTEEWNKRRYSDAARHRFDEWTAQYPALRGFELAEIPFRISTLPRDEADAILHSLISLAQAGHSLAGRCILTAFAPRIIRLVDHPSVKAQCTNRNDMYAHVIAATWETIGTYNLALSTKVVANFAMGMLKHAVPYHVSKVVKHETCCLSPDEIHTYRAFEDTSHTGSRSAAAQVDVILAWAEENHVLRPANIELIRDYYLTSTGHEARIELASRLGISRDALYQRVHRLLSRLQSALAAHIKQDNIS